LIPKKAQKPLWHIGLSYLKEKMGPLVDVCSELKLRLIHDRSLLNLAERLSKEVKRRLKDFSLICPSHADALSPLDM
jgi:hypothetical protein